MPSLTGDESMRHYAALLAIILCLIGLAILQSIDVVPPQPPKKRKKKAAMRHKKKASHAKNNGRMISYLNTLPVELLTHIFGYLAPENVQPHLDGISLHAYKEAQKVLRNVCVVSKQMEAVARSFLYQGVVVNSADVMTYFLRTLDENQTLGQRVKKLVLEVPCSLEDEDYQKPNVDVLETRPNFKKIQKTAGLVSDFDAYQSECARLREIWAPYGLDEPNVTFSEWAYRKECEVFNLMRFEILLRTTNLESLCFGILPSYLYSCTLFVNLLRSPLRLRARNDRELVVPFMSKLTHLHLLGDHKNDQHTYYVKLLEQFLRIASLRRIESFHDDGDWKDLHYYMTVSEENSVSTWPCENISCIDLRRSHCRPLGISQICTRFPALERLFISTDHIEMRRWEDKTMLSDDLAKLKHLRELDLDLHYYGDFKANLGPYGVISLAGLSDLVTLRLPLYFLVEMQPEVEPFVTDMAQALPSSLKRLTVWANMDRVTHSKVTTFADPWIRSANDHVFHPRQSAITFLEAISSRVPDHFRHLEEVTYCYGDKELLAACCCDGDTTCDRCEAWEFLHPHAVGASSARMQILTSDFATRGIRLRIMEAQV